MDGDILRSAGHRLPPLRALSSFEAAARLKSFRGAAEELMVTPSAVSQQIKLLEELLGVPLFLRTSSGLQLTEAGCNYLPFVRSAFDQLFVGDAALHAMRSERSLTLHVMSTFAEQWLMQRLPRFLESHPDIELDLRSLRNGSQMPENADPVIAYGTGHWPGCDSTLLFRERLVPVGHPKWLAMMPDGREAHGDGVLGIDALLSLPLLEVSTTPESWPAWLEAAAHSDPMPEFSQRYDTCGLAMQGARSGLGVMMANEAFVADDIGHGNLVRLSTHSLERREGWYFVLNGARPASREEKAFLEWIRGEAEASGTPA